MDNLIEIKNMKYQYHKDKKLFEVYFEPNKPEHYVFNKDSFIKK